MRDNSFTATYLFTDAAGVLVPVQEKFRCGQFWVSVEDHEGYLVGTAQVFSRGEG